MVLPLRRGAPAADPGSARYAAGQDEVRRNNLGAVLRHVHVHGPTTRAELTTRLGLNRSTIGALAADLTSAGLVTEERPAPGDAARRAGRPSLLVSPRSDAVYANALSIEPDRLRAAQVGLGGHILALRETPRPRDAALLDTVPLLAGLVRSFEPAAGTRCAGGAVAVADTTRAGSADVAGIDATLTAALDAELALSGFVAGDLADIAALAEHTRGVAAGVDDLLYLHGDSGVSAGIVTGGRLVLGHSGHSGRVGHMVVNPEGRRCACGSRGCWETEIGPEALLRLAGMVPAPEVGTLTVVRAAALGDQRAAHALERVGDWLGFGVANLVNVFNPDLVVFGGTLSAVYEAAAHAVRRRLNSMALPASRKHLQLRAATLGPDAALIGAAELALDPLLSDPLG